MIRRSIAVLAILCFAAAAMAADVPRSARLVKDAGNQFLSAKKYSDAIDCYLQALDLCPEFPEAHYNLGVAFLKGYKALALARYHFEQYLHLDEHAADREDVQALVAALSEREDPMPKQNGRVVALVGGRLLLSGGAWARKGDRVDVAQKGQEPCATLLADFVYPSCVLTQRIWDEETLGKIEPGAMAANRSGELLPLR